DLPVFVDLTVKGFTGAGIKTEHSQVKGMQIYRFTCEAHPGAPDSSCVQAAQGEFSVHGGTGSSTTGADFYINGYFTITGRTSHGSRRLLVAGGPTGAGIMGRISGGRFSTDALANDRFAIDFPTPGPFILEDTVLGDGNTPLPRVRLRSFVPGLYIVNG